MKLSSLLILIPLISCNIKQAKDYSKSEVKVSKVHKVQESEENVNKDITLEQIDRENNWIDSKNADKSIDERIESIKAFSMSLSEQYEEYLSDYTKSLIRNEVIAKLEFFNQNIRKISNVRMNKNHVNTKRGKVKDLYIEFTKEISTNDSLVLSLQNEINIDVKKSDLILTFLKSVMEVKINNFLTQNNGLKDIKKLNEDQLYKSLEILESANIIRNKLDELDHEVKVERNLRNKLKLVRIDQDKLEENQILLQIQYFIDIFLE